MPKPSADTINPVQTDKPAAQSLPGRKDWGWSLLWLSVLLVFGGTAGGAFFWLITMPPAVNCKQISPLAPDMERLQCAGEAAATRQLEQLVKGLELVKNWPKDHPLHSQAKELEDQWSKWVLDVATKKMETGDLKGAINIVANIPESSSVYAEAKATAATWEQDWDKGMAIHNKAIQAIKARQWEQATNYTQELSRLRNEYWGQQRMGELLKQITVEKRAWQRLREARDIAWYDTPADLEEAIAQARKVSPQTYAYASAQTEIAQWSRKLLDQAGKRLKERDLDGALGIAKRVPSDSALYPEAQDFMQLSRAELLVPDIMVLNQPPLTAIASVLEAQAAARQLAPNRPLYKQAQAKIADWQTQLQDLLQLQLASTLAGVGQGGAFQLAIDQAQTIGQDRPKRIQAQTLIALWRKELADTQDRPYVVRAQLVAAAGTVDALKAAISEARQVAPGRPLRAEAQSLIAEWDKRIQTLEDQPVLDQARLQAKQGNLSNAIRTAEKIGSNRTLYKQARAAIADWKAQIQIAEDRPKLNEATKQAAQGRLSEAIQIASQIAYGRALYYEAQEGIARWSAERDTIQGQETAAAAEPYPAQTSPPSAESDSPPAQTYSPPAESFSPSAEPYYPPAESYSPSAETYYPPAESYAPPQ
ncbi:hypothetical protein [Kamptonema formosum]|uniref:hypothetical protein n=1 Tax=Kamptonema formosum TaxID=331992 RepID=UPI00035E16CB|nr:hypothetical protein [Oscillatoria sp. PCC 10802]